MPLPRFGRAAPSNPLRSTARPLVAAMAYELVPMAGVDDALTELAPGTPVTVTCSPAKGIAATQRLSETLLDRGHPVVPHLSARLVHDRAEVRGLARWIRGVGIEAAFVVAGDAPTPAGRHPDALSLLRDLLDHDTGLVGIGIAAYPDGHGSIDTEALDEALLAKQLVLADAGIDAWATTQMCFDSRRIVTWLAAQRRRGVEIPMHLGIPGAVDRTHLMRVGLRLGVGTSLRYLRKNRAAMGRLLADGAFDPSRLVEQAVEADADVAGLHCFTFNRVTETQRWQAAFMA